MNTSQLQSILNELSRKTRINYYVLSKDQFQDFKIYSYPVGFIVNNQELKYKGGHWLGFYYKSRNKLFYFDSYGNPPSKYGFNIIPYKSNYCEFQARNTNVCGMYALLFLHRMTCNMGYETFLSIFTSNKTKNDKIVRRFYNKVRKCRISFVHCKKRQYCVKKG